MTSEEERLHRLLIYGTTSSDIYDVGTLYPNPYYGLTYTEFSADHFEDLNEYFKGLEWKRANAQYIKTIFNGYMGLVKHQEECEKIFRKRNVSEIKKSLHELLRTRNDYVR